MLKSIIALGGSLVAALLLAPSAHAQPPGGGYGHGGNDGVRCESRDYRLNRCNVDWREARLIRQISSSRCVRGQNWGIDRRGLWVDRGCGGVFAEAGGRPGGRGHGGPGHGGPGPGGPGGWNPGPDWDRDFRVTCQSNDFRYRFCQIDIGGGGRVRIDRQLSETACIEGRTWGANRAGIWVDRGCGAVFTVDRRWR
jgi:hypothetical protein